MKKILGLCIALISVLVCGCASMSTKMSPFAPVTNFAESDEAVVYFYLPGIVSGQFNVFMKEEDFPEIERYFANINSLSMGSPVLQTPGDGAFRVGFGIGKDPLSCFMIRKTPVASVLIVEYVQNYNSIGYKWNKFTFDNLVPGKSYYFALKNGPGLIPVEEETALPLLKSGSISVNP